MLHSVETDMQPGADGDGTHEVIPLSQFIADFGNGLLDAVREQNPPLFDGGANANREAAMDRLLRKPFPAQRSVVQAVSRLLIDEDLPAGVINAEMGTGKTIMAIAAAAIMHDVGIPRTLVIAPPHLVYKWRREIRETIPGATVWVLNGPDTLRKLLQLRQMGKPPSGPEFFVLGRVRMRMGFNWQPAFNSREVVLANELGRQKVEYATCPDCGTVVNGPAIGPEGNVPLTVEQARIQLAADRQACKECKATLWTLVHPHSGSQSRRELVLDAVRRIPTVGSKTAERLEIGRAHV